MRLVVASSWWPYPPTNGSKLRAWHLLGELTRRHDITLCSFAEDGEAQPENVAALRERCRDVQVLPGNPHKPGGPLSWRGYLGSMPRSYAQTFSPRMARCVADATAGADAVIAFQIGTALYLNSRGHRHRPPRIFDEAEATTIRDQARTGAGTLAGWRQHLTWCKYAAFTRQLVASTTRTTVVSERERQCLGDAGCDVSRIAIVPNGVSREHLDVSVPKSAGTLIYSGSLTYAPNFDAVQFFVTEVLPRVRAARSRVTLSVTGSHAGVSLHPLERDGVTFTGLVPDIEWRVARSEICVVPLRLGGGTRLKILEAMALGTPVVSTSKGAEGLDLKQGEHLLIADGPDAFARAVIDLLEDPDRARALAANARRLIAERYTWNRIGLQLEAILEEAVAVERRRCRS
jgi:glycosyltransferase involved in cell wall biosynthesis